MFDDNRYKSTHLIIGVIIVIVIVVLILKVVLSTKENYDDIGDDVQFVAPDGTLLNRDGTPLYQNTNSDNYNDSTNDYTSQQREQYGNVTEAKTQREIKEEQVKLVPLTMTPIKRGGYEDSRIISGTKKMEIALQHKQREPPTVDPYLYKTLSTTLLDD